MKNSNNFTRFRVYRKMFIIYLVVIITTIILLSILLYVIFYNAMHEEFTAYSLSVLEQTSYTTDIIMNQVYSIQTRMTSNNESLTILYGKKPNYIFEYNVYNNIKDIQTLNPFIYSIGIYNGKIDRYILQRPHSISKESLLDNLPASGGTTMVPRIWFKNDQIKTNLLSIIIDPNFLLKIKPASYVIIDIDEKYLREKMKDFSIKDQNLLILDPNGTVLSHVDSNEFMMDYSQKNWVSKILVSNKSSGNFTSEIDGQTTLVTFVKSTPLDWTFVSTAKVDQLLVNMKKIREYIIIADLIIMLLSIMAFFMLIRNLYRPIRKLLDKFIKNKSEYSVDEFKLITDTYDHTQDELLDLQNKMRTAIPFVKKSYYHSLLTKNKDNYPETFELLNSIIKDLIGPYFSIIIIRINKIEGNDYESSFGNYNKKISLLVDKLATKFLVGKLIEIKNHEFILLLQQKNNQISDKILHGLLEIQTILADELEILISAAIGSSVSSIAEIYISYSTAIDHLNYCFFYGLDSVITPSIIELHSNLESTHPKMLEQDIVSAIHITD